MGHPCVVWAQFLPQGALHVLGGVMGVSMFIEDFCPIALQYRSPVVPRPMEVKSTGDPGGPVVLAARPVATSAIDVLKKYGVQAQTRPAANAGRSARRSPFRASPATWPPPDRHGGGLRRGAALRRRDRCGDVVASVLVMASRPATCGRRARSRHLDPNTRRPLRTGTTITPKTASNTSSWRLGRRLSATPKRSGVRAAFPCTGGAHPPRLDGVGAGHVEARAQGRAGGRLDGRLMRVASPGRRAAPPAYFARRRHLRLQLLEPVLIEIDVRTTGGAEESRYCTAIEPLVRRGRRRNTARGRRREDVEVGRTRRALGAT